MKTRFGSTRKVGLSHFQMKMKKPFIHNFLLKKSLQWFESEVIFLLLKIDSSHGKLEYQLFNRNSRWVFHYHIWECFSCLRRAVLQIKSLNLNQTNSNVLFLFYSVVAISDARMWLLSRYLSFNYSKGFSI